MINDEPHENFIEFLEKLVVLLFEDFEPFDVNQHESDQEVVDQDLEEGVIFEINQSQRHQKHAHLAHTGFNEQSN